MPLNFTNATATCRCSASTAPVAIGPRSVGGRRTERSPRPSRSSGSNGNSAGDSVAAEQEGAVAFRRDQPLEGLRRPCRDEHLAGLGRILEPECRRRRGAADDQLAARPADEEEVARSRDDAGRHAEADRAHARLGRFRLGDERLHRERSASSSLLVAVTVEEQEERVATELQDVSSVALADLDQARSSTR